MCRRVHFREGEVMGSLWIAKTLFFSLKKLWMGVGFAGNSTQGLGSPLAKFYLFPQFSLLLRAFWRAALIVRGTKARSTRTKLDQSRVCFVDSRLKLGLLYCCVESMECTIDDWLTAYWSQWSSMHGLKFGYKTSQKSIFVSRKACSRLKLGLIYCCVFWVSMESMECIIYDCPIEYWSQWSSMGWSLGSKPAVNLSFVSWKACSWQNETNWGQQVSST